MQQQAVFIDQASLNFARTAMGRRPLERRWIQKLINVNKELWLILTILGIAWFINSIVGSDRKSTRLNSSHIQKSRMPSSA